jgi:cell wall-associated NlpC family hydrolase
MTVIELEEKLEKLNEFAPEWRQLVEPDLSDTDAINAAWELLKYQISSRPSRRVLPVRSKPSQAGPTRSPIRTVIPSRSETTRTKLHPAEANPPRSPVKSPPRRVLNQRYLNKVALLDSVSEEWRDIVPIKDGESETRYIDRAMKFLGVTE